MKKISFLAEIDSSKAAKQLDQLKQKIARTTEQLNAATAKRSGIEAQMEAAGQKADETREKVKRLKAELATATANVENSKIGGTPTLETYKAQDVQSRIQAQLTTQEGILKGQVKDVDLLGRQWDKADSAVQRITSTLHEQQSAAGKIEQQLGSTFDPAKLKQAGQSIKSHLAGGFKTVLKYVLGIRSLYILFRMIRSAVTEGIKEMTKYDSGVNKTVSNLKNSLTGLKASLASAFAPLLQAIAPILTKIINLCATVINYVGMLFAALSGAKTYKKAIATQTDYAKSLQATGAAAKQAAAYLSGLDEIQRYDDGTSGGGGGGGAAAGMMEGLEEVEIPQWINKISDILSQFKLTFDEVLFDWGDWNAEKILKKAIAAIPLAAGIITGATIGGLPGALIGAAVGLTLGLIADMLTFDNDGKISRKEFSKLLAAALIGLMAGGAVLAIGAGIGPALLAITAGFTLALVLTGMDPIRGKSASEIDEYLTALDEKFKDAEPGTYAQSYWERWHRYAVREYENAGGEASEKFNEKFKTDMEKRREKLQAVVDQIRTYVQDNIVPKVDSFKAWYEQKVAPWFTQARWQQLGNDARVKLETAIAPKVEAVKTWYEQKVAPWFTNAKWQTVAANARQQLEGNIAPKTEAVKQWYNNNVAPWFTQARWQQLGRDAKTKLESTFTIKSEAVKQWYNNSVAPWFTTAKWQTVATNARQQLENSVAPKTEAVKQWYNNNVAPWFTAARWRSLAQDAVLSIRSGFNLDYFSPISSWFSNNVAPWFSWYRWQQLGRDAMDALSRALSGVSMPKFHFDWNWETKYLKILGKTYSMTIPWPNLSFYARGGIINGPVDLGGGRIAGEAGKEAIVPLERHTEWIDLVANGLADILIDKLGAFIMRTPMPAVAAGTMLPPRITVDLPGLSDLRSDIQSLREALLKQQNGGEYTFVAQLNRRTLFDETIKEAQLRQATTGRNPFDL